LRFLAALRFLTIIRLPYRREAAPADLGGSIVYFPVVGIIIGLILAGLGWLFSLFLPPAVVSGLLIVFMVIISGGLHLDGLVDTCDGIAGHKTVEERWEVMRDSRAGAFGIIGVILVLLVKFASLNSVPRDLLLVTLLIMPVVSRWAMVYTVFAYPYARPAGLGKTFKDGAGWQRFAVATVITLALTIGLAVLMSATFFYLVGLVIIFGVWVIVVALAAYLRRKFAGLTGDTYGAINEVAEVAVLVLVSLLAHNQWLGLA
jgi:adenosylcobinamide-GDP ribazoletransferase